MKKYNHSVLGGTFDNLHKGHKFLIEKAIEASEKVTIGITTDQFLKSLKNENNFQSHSVRKSNLQNFLAKNIQLITKIIPIDDIYGNTLKDKNIDAIFVTKDTLQNAERINREREKLGFKNLKIEIVDLVMDELDKPISSTSIRKGEINDLGKYYNKYFIKDLKLIDNYREDFKKPIGRIIKRINISDFKNRFIIAIGDVAVSKLVSEGILPNISIYDLITKREKITNEVKKYLPEPDIELENQQGTINSITTKKLQEIIVKSYKSNKKYSIKIAGEEDLMTIPAVLLSPVGSLVFYGLRNVGGILINIDLAKKKDIENNFLPKFEKL